MGERTENVRDSNVGETLTELARTIKARSESGSEQSYTAQLLRGPEEKLFKKIVEEAFEVAMAAKDNDHDHIRYEAADLLYHLMVLLEQKDITLEELAGELRARMK